MAINVPSWISTRTRNGIGAVLVGLVLVVPGCELNRHGISSGVRAPSVVVAPEFTCPSEEIVIRWDYSTLPRTTTNCTSCMTSSACGAGSTCLDGFCCPDRYRLMPGGIGVPGCRSAEGVCLPPSIVMTLSSDPPTALPTPPEPMPLRGELRVLPTRPMTITATTRFAFPFSEFTDVWRVRINDALDDRIAMPMTFSCPAGAWDPYDFARRGPSTSDRMEIRGITNLTLQPVTLSGGIPRRDGVPIRSGEVSEMFDGSPPRGAWFGFIPSSVLPDPRARPCEVLRGERPPINLSMRVVCRPL